MKVIQQILHLPSCNKEAMLKLLSTLEHALNELTESVETDHGIFKESRDKSRPIKKFRRATFIGNVEIKIDLHSKSISIYRAKI